MGSTALSIIVPIYNTEKYLSECLNSFVQQTCKDFTVILVNDGSTDNSEKIIEDYVKKYPNLFKYVKQENKGLGGARNTGLDHVQSKHVMFFDSDDFCADRMVEKVLGKIKKTNSDIIFFNPTIYNMVSSSYEPWHDASLLRRIFSKKDIINVKKFPILYESEASVCRAVWKTSFLERAKLRFLEKVHWEDVPPHFYLLHEAESASFLDYEGCYFYRINSGNQITSSSGRDRLDIEIIYKEIEPFFISKKWKTREKSHMIGFLSNYIFWSLHAISVEYRKEFVDICYNFFKKLSLVQYINFFFKSKVCLRNKIMIYFLMKDKKRRELYTNDSVTRKMKIFNKIFRKK